ncbi:ABC transporter ATP-binding protein [Mycetocola manganoxydans]|uniref:ABC transporter ATP-binding protein n=1 Tax=Mycetocola manganoxydans TaxID=699879 RepID=A0A3L7A1L8_9MICO|nr:ABC transporter ATP-binding protein [Mycetocola manganoxydans]RLP73875.1 ABC transporter ATP-binding protein [Mycetocola manganoxydans]GHD42577.1 ABC transporter ATP-binding protein [Mycetocola manganoxydans]
MKLLWQTLKKLLPLLPPRARNFLWTYVVLSSALALLDVAAIGLLALSMAAMVQSEPVNLPLVGAVDQSGYVWILVAVSTLIILKSGLSVLLQWRATRRFAKYELEIGDRLFGAYIQAPWTERLQRNTSQLVRMADVGIAAVVAGFLLPVLSLPTLFTTSISVLVVIVIAQPVTALVTVVYLGLIAFLLYFWVSRKSVEAGRVNRDYSFKVASLMTDMVSALKEITLRNKAGEVAAVIHSNRLHTTRARANLSFLGAVPKFVLESALVGGFILVGGVAYWSGGMAGAFAAVALFAVAGFRLVPSLTGFQSVITQTHSNIPQVRAVMGDIHKAEGYLERGERIGHDPLKSEPKVLELRDVAFTYPGGEKPAVTGIDLTIPMGSTVGLVGSSGAGKSTLVDILLGLLVPSGGDILIDGIPLEGVLADWRSRVGYVPQDVALFDGSVAENVALSWTGDFDRVRVQAALERAQLWDVVMSRAGGMDARVGERGMSLSGGQRQRLGIARALYSDPLILVLDEATSALDTKTESDVSIAIRELRGEVTIISVAHRLSTIRDNDQVVFMRDGRIVTHGSFDEVVRDVEDFSVQARLAGLVD